MTTAMIRAVRTRFPKARIDMVVREDFLDLIRENPHLDQKIPLSRGSGILGLWQLANKLRKERYDLIYDAHRSLRTRVLMPFLSAETKAYFPKHYFIRALALTFKLHLLKPKRFLEKFIEPLEKYGVRYDGKGPEIFVSETAKKSARAKVPFPNGPVVGIIPSAQWPGKRWPTERFRATVERLVRETSFKFIVFGGKEDHFCETICAGLPLDRVVNAQGKLTLAESIALVEDCRYVIANDTGLLHVADGLSKPSVLLLGPTSAELGCLPFHAQSRVLEHDLWCRPCSKNGQAPCIRGHRYCLDLTTVGHVVEAAKLVGASA